MINQVGSGLLPLDYTFETDNTLLPLITEQPVAVRPRAEISEPEIQIELGAPAINTESVSATKVAQLMSPEVEVAL